MPFIALHIQFAPLAHHERTQGEDAHMCAHVSRGIARLLDQMHKASTWITVARLGSTAAQEHFRVTLSGKHVLTDAQELCSSLTAYPLLTHEEAPYHVLSIELAQTPGGAVSSWTDVLAPPPRRPLQLRFVTPLLLERDGEDTTQAGCFPQPWLVFETVFNRWCQLGGPMLSEQLLPWIHDRGCVVSEYHLQGVPIPGKSGEGSSKVTIGWTGWITYSCREGDVAHMAGLWALARFAAFVGLGVGTEYGFGVTQVIEQGKEHVWTGGLSK